MLFRSNMFRFLSANNEFFEALETKLNFGLKLRDQLSIPDELWMGMITTAYKAFKNIEVDRITFYDHGIIEIKKRLIPHTKKIDLKFYLHVGYQEYKIGVPQYPVKEVGTTDITGTTVHFHPDDTIFTVTEYNYERVATRLRERSEEHTSELQSH